MGDRHRAPPAVVVFDVDGTLIDTRSRTVQVLSEYADDIRAEVPGLADALEALGVDEVQYLLSDTLRERGIVHPDQVRDITHYWRDRYFSEEYFQFDAPHTGAAEYVRALHGAGATVVYLSSRDAYAMLIGTVESLREHSFPMGAAGVELVLNADPGLSDEAFKRAILPKLSRVGEVVGYFDNEPANCNWAKACFPDADVVLLETVKVPGAPVSDNGVEHLADFRLE